MEIHLELDVCTLQGITYLHSLQFRIANPLPACFGEVRGNQKTQEILTLTQGRHVKSYTGINQSPVLNLFLELQGNNMTYCATTYWVSALESSRKDLAVHNVTL